MPNGVQVAALPQEVYTSKRLRRLAVKKKIVDGREIIYVEKTIFPKKWSEDEIVRAIEDVEANKASFKEIKQDATFITGSYKGVKIRIILRDEEIRTAFPLAH